MRQQFFRFLLALSAMLTSITGYSADEKVEFTADNTVVLRGEVSDATVAKTMAAIITSPSENLYLFISSPGGSIIDGLRLVSLLRSTDKHITCVTNFAASMAFVMLQACEKRLVTEDAVIMQHVAAYSLRGPEPNNWSMANFIRRMVKKMDEMQSKRIGISYDEFKAKTRDDWWLFDGEAVAANAADGTAIVSCSKDLAKKSHTEKVQTLFFSVDVVWSDCPLIEAPLEVKSTQQAGFGSREAADDWKKFQQSLEWRSRTLLRFNGDKTIELPELIK